MSINFVKNANGQKDNKYKKLRKEIGIMRVFQLILAVITVLMAGGMFAFNLWIGANFSKGLELPGCYIPMNYITAGLVLLTVILIFVRK
jgi:hypothetical protein